MRSIDIERKIKSHDSQLETKAQQTDVKKATNDIRKAEMGLISLKPTIEKFKDELDKWDYTKGIEIVNDMLTITSSNTMANHLSVALFDDINNARGIETTLGSGGLPHMLRVVFGRDKQNFAYITMIAPWNVINIYTIEGGRLNSASANAHTLSLTKQPIAGDKIKMVRQGQNLQVFVNNILAGTYGMPHDIRYIAPVGVNLKAGVGFRDFSNAYFLSEVKIYPNRKYKYMHFSMDDTIMMFKDLADKSSTYTSIFDNTNFAFLKSMHDKYGAVFTLNLFYQDKASGWNLSSMPTKYVNEFRKNADWLKFTFHAFDTDSNYGNGTLTSTDALNHYNLVINAIRTFAHPYCIDTVTRLGFFAGTIDVCRTLRDAECGIKGFLTADDTRANNMYLNATQTDTLSKCDDFLDTVEDIYFVRTDMRLENYYDTYMQELNSRIGNYAYVGQNDIMEIFTHESGFGVTIKSMVENICNWGLEQDYVFDFPMNNIPKC